MNLHSEAVEAAVKAAGDRLTPADQPLVELARVLASQMDAAGPDGPGTRLAGSYLTCIRSLTARLGSLIEVRGTGALARMRAERPILKPAATVEPRRAL